MQAGDIKPILYDIIARLKEIARNTDINACCTAITSSGVGINIPAGFASISIAQVGTGNVVVTMSDSSTYTLSADGEILVQAAPTNKTLPAYTITGSASWKWVAIK